MVSDALLLLIALTGLSATVLVILYFAGYFRGSTVRPLVSVSCSWWCCFGLSYQMTDLMRDLVACV